MSFDATSNNLVKLPVVSHANGSPSLVLGIAGTTLPAAPFRLTAVTGATYGTAAESLTIFGVSAVATNTPSAGQCTLTVSAIEGTTDQTYGSSDFGEVRLTAGTIADLDTAVSTLQTNTITITAGSGLSGGGTVTLGAGGTITLSSTAGGGSVTSVSVVTANGFAGSVATATTTPAITLTTSITGVLKGNGTAISAATANTDYVTPSGNITGTSSNVTGTVTAAHGGTGLATLTAHAVLLGEGTGNVAFATVATAGRVLIDQGAAADPAFAAVSGDATLASSGALTVASIGGKAVTLGGSLTTSGAFAVTLTATAPTSVTLPVSGTLATLAATTLSSLASIGTITTGTWQATAIAPQYGGTGVNAAAATNGQLLIGNGTGFTLATLTAGSNVTVTNSAGGITIAATGGGGSPGGSTGQVQYNSAGSFAGAANLAIGSSGQLNHVSMAAPGSPTNGDDWHDSTQHASAYRQSGLTIFQPGIVYIQTATATAAAAAATSLIATTGAVGTVALPAGFLNVAGRSLRIRAGGYMSTAASSPGNISLTGLLGTTPIVGTGGAGLGTSTTNIPWECDCLITVVATGVTGTVQSGGIAVARNPFSSATTIAIFALTNASGLTTVAAQTPVTLDTTQAYTLDFQAIFTATGNSLTLTRFAVEVIG